MCDTLAVRPGQRLHTLVHLDTSDNTLLLQHLGEWDAIGVLLVKRLFEHDYAGNVLLQAFGGKEQITVIAAVGLGVLDIDRLEAITNGTGGLISGQDALASGGNGSSVCETSKDRVV